MFVAAMYAEKPQGQFGRLARPRTWMPLIVLPNWFAGTGHAFVRPRGRGRSCSS